MRWTTHLLFAVFIASFFVEQTLFHKEGCYENCKKEMGCPAHYLSGITCILKLCHKFYIVPSCCFAYDSPYQNPSAYTISLFSAWCVLLSLGIPFFWQPI